MHGSMNIKNQI